MLPTSRAENEPGSGSARLDQAEPRFWVTKPSPSRAEPAFGNERAEPSLYSSARSQAEPSQAYVPARLGARRARLGGLGQM